MVNEMNKELDIIVETYPMAGGEYTESVGRVPPLVVECLVFLLERCGDAEARSLITRLHAG